MSKTALRTLVLTVILFGIICIAISLGIYESIDVGSFQSYEEYTRNRVGLEGGSAWFMQIGLSLISTVVWALAVSRQNLKDKEHHELFKETLIGGLPYVVLSFLATGLVCTIVGMFVPAIVDFYFFIIAATSLILFGAGFIITAIAALIGICYLLVKGVEKANQHFTEVEKQKRDGSIQHLLIPDGEMIPVSAQMWEAFQAYLDQTGQNNGEGEV